MNKKAVRIAFGNALTEIRNRQGISQQELSDLSGVDRSHITDIELGIHSPTFYIVFKIANGLNMLPHQLLMILESKLDSNG